MSVCAKVPALDWWEIGMRAAKPPLLSVASDEESRDMGQDEQWLEMK